MTLFDNLWLIPNFKQLLVVKDFCLAQMSRPWTYVLYSCLRSLASPRGTANLTAYVCEQKLINENYVPILKMDQNTINSANCLVGNLLILMVLLNLLYFIIEYEQIIVGWISYLVIKNEKYNRTFF